MRTEAASEQGLLGNIKIRISFVDSSHVKHDFAVYYRSPYSSAWQAHILLQSTSAFRRRMCVSGQEQDFLRWLPVKTSIFPLIFLERQSGRDLDLSIRISRSTRLAQPLVHGTQSSPLKR